MPRMRRALRVWSLAALLPTTVCDVRFANAEMIPWFSHRNKTRPWSFSCSRADGKQQFICWRRRLLKPLSFVACIRISLLLSLFLGHLLPSAYRANSSSFFFSTFFFPLVLFYGFSFACRFASYLRVNFNMPLTTRIPAVLSCRLSRHMLYSLLQPTCQEAVSRIWIGCACSAIVLCSVLCVCVNIRQQAVDRRFTERNNYFHLKYYIQTGKDRKCSLV